MRIAAILLLLCPLFLISQEGSAEALLDISGNQELSELLSDGKLLYAISHTGEVLDINIEDGKATKTGIHIVPNEEYPFIFDSELYTYNRAGGLRCLTSENELASFGLPDEIMSGNDAWLLTDIQQSGEQILYYYYDALNGIAAICCSDHGENEITWHEESMMTEFFCDTKGETYAVVYNSELDITTVSLVKWGEASAVEILSLSGQYSEFQASEECFFAINNTKSNFVQITDGQEIKSIYSPYASAVIDSVIYCGEYWVCGAYGIYSPTWAVENQEKRILRIQGSGPNEIDQAFLLNHPNVQIEYVPSTAYESTGVYNAIISGVIELDVCLVDTSLTARAFLKKGYTLDLSIFPEIHNRALSMYEPIQEFIFEDDKLLFLPYSMDLGAILEYRTDALDAVGLNASELPRTIEGLLDFITEWNSDEVVPILFDESPHKELLLRVMDSYIAYYRHTDSNLTFNTPTFRRLLTKTREAASASEVQTSEFNPEKIYMQVGAEIPGVHSVAFPLTENESPRYTGRLFGWAVVADSEQVDLAVEYIVFRTEQMAKATAILLYDDEYEAIEREYFSTLANEWLSEIERLQMQLESEDNPIEQRDIKDQIVKLNEQITNPPASLRYAITEDEIMFYQKEVLPNIEFVFSNPVTDPSITSLWAMQLVEQYTTGIISDDKFIRELDNRIWMMEMEVSE